MYTIIGIYTEKHYNALNRYSNVRYVHCRQRKHAERILKPLSDEQNVWVTLDENAYDFMTKYMCNVRRIFFNLRVGDVQSMNELHAYIGHYRDLWASIEKQESDWGIQLKQRRRLKK